MKRTQPGRAASWLPLMIRLTAVGYLLFFVPDLILASTHHINGLPRLLARLFDWGAGGDPVAVMFATVYVVWALFLFRAASAPLIQPPSSNNGAYCASVKSESDRVCHGGEGMSETVSVNF